MSLFIETGPPVNSQSGGADAFIPGPHKELNSLRSWVSGLVFRFSPQMGLYRRLESPPVVEPQTLRP